LPVSEDGKVSLDRRVREVKLELQGENTAAVRFITVEDWKKGRPGTEKQVDL